MADFIQKLRDDLVEQFRGQPNIEAVIYAVGRQLQEVSDFYDALRTQRSIEKAVGAQLDGAGDIVVLSRAEAGQLASITSPGEAVTDETYRRYITYKVLKNTNICTYWDIIRAFQMFWDRPLYYSEDPETPATMIFKTGVLPPGAAPENLLKAPIIKAAGVGVKVIATTQTEEMEGHLFVGVALGRGYTITRLPELLPDYHFTHTEKISVAAHNITKTTLPELKEV